MRLFIAVPKSYRMRIRCLPGGMTEITLEPIKLIVWSKVGAAAPALSIED